MKDIFGWIDRNVPGLPDHDGVEAFSTRSHGDGALVEGWSWKPRTTARGTLFCLHGFADSCRNPGAWPHWLGLAARFDMALVAFDFRHHGKSSDRWPTFGCAESWDLLGAMDRAEALGLPRPYIINAGSLGALAAQRAAVVDRRIKGCFLAEPPQCPWHAIGSTAWNALPGLTKALLIATPVVGLLINNHYGWDVLKDGDCRAHPAIRSPVHQPLMFFIMGAADCFEIRKTRMVYDTWYGNVPGVDGHGLEPHREPGARKWFVEVPDAHHSGGNGRSVYEWAGYGACQNSFMRRCLYL